MESNLNRYVRTLWLLAAIFIGIRYFCASIMVAGALGDRGTYRLALEALGPFLPTMAVVCLAGSLALLLVDLIVSIRNKKK